MKKTNMVSIIYYLTIKFPTPTGVGYIKADQVTAQQCHIQSIHLSKQAVFEPEKVVTGDVLAIKRNGSGIDREDLDPREDYPKPEPVEQTEEIDISGEGRTTRIGSCLHHNQKMQMTLLLRENSDVFAWLAAEMPGIPPSGLTFFKCQSFSPTSQTKKKKAGSREVNCSKARDLKATEGRLHPESTLP